VIGLLGLTPLASWSQGVPQSRGGEARVVTFDIRAQDLDSALTRLADQAGLRLLFASSDVAGLRSPGVRDRIPVAEALRRVLAGSGFTWRFTEANTVVLERLPPANTGARVLPPLQVAGASNEESAYGPVAGYVAKKAASGTKTDTPLIEMPQTVNVVTRDEMDAQAVKSVPQALRYTPGIRTELAGVDNRIETNQIFVRGFAPDEYLDGLRLVSGVWANTQIDPFMLERIEILKGPASVLYGQASPGGILSLTSKRPALEPLNQVGLEFGSHDFKQGSFDVGGKFDADGRLAFRVVGLGRDSDTQVDFTELQRLSITPSLQWRPTADTSLTILVNLQDDPKAGFFNQLPQQGTLLENPNGRIPTSFYSGEPDFDKYSRRQETVSTLFEHRFDDTWTVRQNFRYAHMKGDFRTVFPFALEPDNRTLDRVSFAELEKADAFTVDNQVQSKFVTGSLRHTVLAGLDYQRLIDDAVARDGLDILTIDIFAPVYHQPVPFAPIDFDRRQIQNQLGVYLQDQVKFDRLTLLLGARQDWADNKIDNRLTHVTSKTSDDALTWRAGAIYEFDFGLAPYASYTESFQPQSGTDFFGVAFNPTTGQQYEVGLKFQPQGYNSFVTVAAFQLTQQNVLTADPDPTHFLASVQTGEIRVRGFEVEGKASLTEGLNLTAAYSYTNPIVTKANDASLGLHPVSIPDQTASIWADYTIQRGSAAGLGFGGGMRWVDQSYADTLNTLRAPGYFLFDAAVHYDLGRLDQTLYGAQLAINATNLFDREYLASCSDLGCGYGLRRAVFGQIKYQW
jgi:iron complex outermembrane receptor protein